jgi:TPR repeat protein
MKTRLILLAILFSSVHPPQMAMAQAARSAGNVEKGLLAAAKGGDAVSQLLLANCYQNGTCAPFDPDEALGWYRKAAESGNATAQFIIAWEYFDGSDVGLAPKNHIPKDPDQAAVWFRRVAEHADSIDFSLLKDAPPAARAYGTMPSGMGGEGTVDFLLGSLFEEGKEVTRDYSQAVFWYRRGADKGQADAESSLGDLYADGEGVPQDSAQAAKWFRKAADQGQVDAEVNLATLYFDGHGVVQNYDEAHEWLMKAFDKGSTTAAFNLGVIYGKGLGVDLNPSATYFFFAISAAGGHGTEQQDATKNRDIAAAQLSQQEVTKLQKKASEWFAAHPPLAAPQ